MQKCEAALYLIGRHKKGDGELLKTPPLLCVLSHTQGIITPKHSG